MGFIDCYHYNDACWRHYIILSKLRTRHKRALCYHVQTQIFILITHSSLQRAETLSCFTSVVTSSCSFFFFFYGGEHIWSWPWARSGAICYYSRKAGNCGRDDKPFLSASSRFSKADPCNKGS